MNKKFWLKKIKDLVFLIIVAFVFIKFTTYGSKFWATQTPVVLETDNSSARTIKKRVHFLSEEVGDRSVFNHKNLEKAKDYIAKEFKTSGYSVEFQTYKAAAKDASNIIAVKKGRLAPDEVVIIGAHYDTEGTKGADDNASGTACLLELADRFSKSQPAKTLKFIAFVNEEPPFFTNDLMGSMVYAGRAKKDGENIKAAIVLEMLGFYSQKPFSQRYPPFIGPFYPNRGNFVAIVGNLNSRDIVSSAGNSFRSKSTFPVETAVLPFWIPGVAFSDHYSFWKNGYKAVMVTDTAFFRNSNYHKASDTADTLNYDYMSEIVNGLESVIKNLAE